MDRLKTRLLQALVFLIPTNLALHWHLPQATLFGKTIDYLLPKLYLADIPLILLIIILLLNHQTFDLTKNLFKKHKSRFLLALLAFALLALRSLTTPLPISSLWQLIQILKVLLLTCLLSLHYSPKTLLHTIAPPAFLSLVFQASLALYQFFTQSHLVGYFFFGEPSLTSGPHLARGVFFGHLLTLPYATTPHPNVLAGLSLIFLLWILGATVYNPKHYYLYDLSHISFGLTLLIILLTQSLSSLIAFVIVSSLLILTHFRRKHPKTSVNRLVSSSILLIFLLAAFASYHSTSQLDTNSITRRYKLISLSFSLFFQAPLTGIGLNQFIPVAAARDQSLWFYTFPQPVHNVYLLWLTETGFIITLTTLWLFIPLARRLKSILNRPHLVTPLLALAVIALFDHYPLTLNQGLLVLSLSFPLLTSTKPIH